MAITQPTPAKVGVRQRERNALQRIEQIESDFSNLTGALQGVLGQIDQRIGASTEIVDALVALLGPEQVNNQIQATRDQRAVEQAQRAKDALQKAVADNKYVAALTVGANSVVTGTEYDKDGVILKPGYVQLAFASIKPEFQEKIQGQGVGFSFETGEGGKFEITGVFDPVVSSPEEEIVEDVEE